MAGRSQPASGLVDVEGNNIVATLIRNQQELACRSDREVARPVASGRSMFDQFEISCLRIDFEDDDAVVSTIRSIQEPA